MRAHPVSRYKFGTEPGGYNAILHRKEFCRTTRSKFMRLYFQELDRPHCFYLCVFYRAGYEPPNGGPDFKDEVPTGSPVWIEVGHSPTGKPALLRAEYGWRHN